MSKKSKETEALLEEEVQNEGIQTLAGEPETDTGTTHDSDEETTVDDTTTSDSSNDETSPTTDDVTEIPSNFNLSYFWNHYGYIEQNSFTSYIQQLEDGADDSGSDDGDSTAGKDTESGLEEE